MMRLKDLEQLSNQEMSEIKGGSWLGDVFDAIGDALSDAWEWVKEHVKPRTDGSTGVDIYF